MTSLSQRAQRSLAEICGFVSGRKSASPHPPSGCRLTISIMAPSFDTLTEQDLHEEEEEEIDFSGAC